MNNSTDQEGRCERWSDSRGRPAWQQFIQDSEMYKNIKW